MQAARKMKQLWTHQCLSHEPSRLTKDLITKAIAIKESQISAGVLSISRMKGPESQKIAKNLSTLERALSASRASSMIDRKLFVMLCDRPFQVERFLICWLANDLIGRCNGAFTLD